LGGGGAGLPGDRGERRPRAARHALPGSRVPDLSTIDDLDPCGEQGEYHTYVFDGPDFRSPVEFTVGETVDIEDHRFIDLVPIAAGAEAGRLGPT
jgi:hypothetical protein